MRFAAGVIALCAIVVAVHRPVLSAQALCFDDREFLGDNILVRNPSWSGAARFVTEVSRPSTVHGYYIPLTMISLMADSALGGRPDDLGQFHRTNLALHLATMVALVVLLPLLGIPPIVALLFGLLYGVHPLTVEPIAWIGERKTVLATALVMWSLVSYVGYVQRGSRTLLVTSLWLFLLSLTAKPTTVPLPVLLLLLDYWPLNRLSRRAVVEKIPYLVLGAISAVVTVISNANTAKVSLPSDDSSMPVFLRVCHNLVFYVWKLLWPVDLTPYYPPPDPFTFSQTPVWLGVVGTAILLAALVASRRWTRVWVVGGGFFLIALMPTLGIIGFSWILASDKYLYFPMVGLILSGSYYVTRLWHHRGEPTASFAGRVAIIGAFLIAASVLAVGTRRYLAHWATSESLYRYMLTLAPKAPVLHYSLANVLSDRGENDEAGEHYADALRENKDYADALVGLGKVRYLQGRMDEAIEHFQAALRLNPRSAEAHNNLGTALDMLGRFDEAVHHMNEALRINPENVPAYFNLGVAYIRQGRVDEAVENYQMALRLNPQFLEACANLAAAYESQGQLDHAIRYYREALRINPTQPAVHQRLANLLAGQGQADEANRHLAESQYGQGLILEQRGELDRAVTAYREALRLLPGHAGASERLQACLSRFDG